MGVCKVDDYLEDALGSLRGRATNDSAGFGHLRFLNRLPYPAADAERHNRDAPDAVGCSGVQ